MWSGVGVISCLSTVRMRALQPFRNSEHFLVKCECEPKLQYDPKFGQMSPKTTPVRQRHLSEIPNSAFGQMSLSDRCRPIHLKFLIKSVCLLSNEINCPLITTFANCLLRGQGGPRPKMVCYAIFVEGEHSSQV